MDNRAKEAICIRAGKHSPADPNRHRQQTASNIGGLSSDEAKMRLERCGFNELSQKRQSPIIKFLSYFWGPIPWMIEVAAVLSVVIHHWVDFSIIAIMLVINAFIGFWEEYQAGGTIDALKAKLAAKSRVRRDGRWIVLEVRELVPGDIIRLRPGDIVPADATIINEDTVQVDQATLTGESLPVPRTKDENLFSGSTITQGETVAEVTATGDSTYFGKTAKLVESGNNLSHLHRAILKIGDYLIVIAFVLLAVILTVSAFRGEQFAKTLQFALVLVVAAIPIAMPTVLSVTLAAGARLLAAKKAIVTKLSSIEELAGIDVLCSDKTGTLTRNELTVAEPYLVDSRSATELKLMAALASKAENNDPIDQAVLAAQDKDSELSSFELLDFMPFDPVQKRTEAELRAPDGNVFKVSKGAPQVILSMATNSEKIRETVTGAINDFAQRGYRSLGIARTDKNGRWRFLGILPLHDPPRNDSRQILDQAREMGIDVKMITGDQKAIAVETARQLKIGTNIYEVTASGETGKAGINLSPSAIDEADGFAQVFPDHKYAIVKALQDRKHIVGMTGDGVNDVPALTKADVGIAVSGATDAARSASAIVLLGAGLSVIVTAIRESRKIFERMKAYATYRIAETIRVLLFMTLSILAFQFYPVTAVMIVLLALLNDGAILSIAVDDANEQKTPQSWNLKTLLPVATVLGLIGVLESFGLFYLAENVIGLSRDMIQTLIYLKLSVAGHLTIFVARTEKPFWSSKPSPILISAVLGTQAIATVIAVYGFLMTPLGWSWAALVWGYAVVWMVIEDAAKLVAYRLFKKSNISLFGRSHRSWRRLETISGRQL